MTHSAQSIPVIDSVAALSEGVDAWISDIWGVMHNGATAFTAAGEACVRFRRQGGTVVLVTNAPYPAARVASMLGQLKVPREAYDDIVTSGDVTQRLIVRHEAVYHLGPDRYLGIFDGQKVKRAARPEEASAVLVTGLLNDEHETPEDYRERLDMYRAQGLPLICANPDIVVERGPKLIYCAGALAEAYAKAGGDVLYAGKPHAPIYEEAFLRLAAVKGHSVPRERILAIGDGIRTDIAGAGAMGLKSLFISSALHVKEHQTLDTALLAELFAGSPHPPVAAQTGLRW